MLWFFHIVKKKIRDTVTGGSVLASGRAMPTGSVFPSILEATFWGVPLNFLSSINRSLSPERQDSKNLITHNLKQKIAKKKGMVYLILLTTVCCTNFQSKLGSQGFHLSYTRWNQHFTIFFILIFFINFELLFELHPA